MSIPVTLYSPDGRRTREIAAIDAPGWIKAGWSLVPVEKQPISVIPIAEVESQTPVVPIAEVESQTKLKK